jgi:hypothetical protein
MDSGRKGQNDLRREHHEPRVLSADVPANDEGSPDRSKHARSHKTHEDPAGTSKPVDRKRVRR